MLNAFQLGGFAMYPTALFGIALLVAAIAYARNPGNGKLIDLFKMLSCVVIGSGLFGCITGFMCTLDAATNASADQRLLLVLTGTSETLNNVALALAAFVCASIFMAVGAFRLAISGHRKAGIL